MTLAVHGTLAGVREAVETLQAWSGQEGLSDETRRRLLTTLDEVLSNVVRHGFRDRAGLIDLMVSREGEIVRAEVADDAGPFNPLLAPAPDTSGPLEARKPGGLGIALVRALTDDVRYERRGDRNRLTLTWRI
ncbi:MAG TPA: ATP-binding protein [Vicinamibacterales bacterium]|nr:ATP-binding protein [Vicinamibacterales bacterium]